MRKYCYCIPSAVKHAILFQHLHPRINKVLDVTDIHYLHTMHTMPLLLHTQYKTWQCFLDHNFTLYLKFIEKVQEKIEKQVQKNPYKSDL